MPPLTDVGNAIGFFDFGAANSVALQSGDRVLSYYGGWNPPGRWILWDTTTHTAITQGPTIALGHAYMVGDLFVVQSETGIDLFDAITGQMQATIPIARSDLKGFALANDGSYVLLILSTGNLEVWAPDGTMLLSVVGNYHDADVFSAPTELRVAEGPAGANRIERIPLDGTPSTISPSFPEPFYRWMIDGEHFYTLEPTRFSVYSKDAALINSNTIVPPEYLHGSGDYYWTFDSVHFSDSRLEIYSLNSGSTPIAHYSFASRSAEIIGASPNTIALRLETNDSSVHLFHLGPVITEEIVTTEYGGISEVSFDPTNDFWTLRVGCGVLWQHGTTADPQAEGLLGCGAVAAMAGTPTGYLAVSTGTNRVFVFDMNAGGALKTIVPTWAGTLAISDDGSILAINNGNVRTFSTLNGNLLHLFSPAAYSFALSRGGTRMSLVPYSNHVPRVTDLNETLTFYEMPPTTNYPPLPSPNGQNLTVPTGSGATATTLLYVLDPTGGPPTLTSSVNGTATGWIDDEHFLAYTMARHPRMPWDTYDKTIIYDTQGNVQAILPNIPPIYNFDAVEGTWFYSPYHRTVYDWQTGAIIWTNPVQGEEKMSAAAGRRVVFLYQGSLYFESF